MPCHYSWVRVLYDFIRNPDLGPQSRIRRTIRSDALKTNNVLDLKNKSKVNEILHEVIDNNNNNHHHHHTQTYKDERKLLNVRKHSIVISNGHHHSKTE
jgi:hypothetical protein